MGKKISIFLLIFLTAILQVSLFSNFFQSHAIPDAVLILVIIGSSLNEFSHIWSRVVLAGIILDLASLNPIGFNIFSFLVISFFSCYLSKKFFTDRKTINFFILAGLIAAGTVFDFFIINFLFFLRDYFLGSGTFIFFESQQFKNLILKEIGNLIIFASIYFFTNLLSKKSIMPQKILME